MASMVPDKSLMMKVVQCPTDELSLTNCAVTHPDDIDAEKYRHIVVKSEGTDYYFSIRNHNYVKPGTIGFSAPLRKWAVLSINQPIMVRSYKADASKQNINQVKFTVDILSKKTIPTEPYDTDKMAPELAMQFSPSRLALTKKQRIVFQMPDRKPLMLTVKEIQVTVYKGESTSVETEDIGFFSSNTVVTFEQAENGSVRLTGKAKGMTAFKSAIPQDWDFNKMGIGGLDNEFSTIFRRAFASRVFPPDLVEQLGMKHVKGMLLFGPPGTGKTLIARQIGKMLNAREPKIVNGPQILDKYVGESEANIRKLFAEAEEEQARCGNMSGLHIIILDEIDAICKARGSVAGSTAVHDTVVNQLLSKIDGVEEINNILIIGMTNRKDMIDEALLRPGRLEVQMEISLPDEHGRVQILNIHTAQIKDNGKLGEDVDILELAQKTKNFSGAELAGLVRAAGSTAMNRYIKASTKIELETDAVEKLKVTSEDFMAALQDIKPAFGSSEESLEPLMANGIQEWGDPVEKVLVDGQLLLRQARNSDKTPLVSVLIEGPPQSGKTALAAKIALDSQFPFTRVCTPENMIGFTESAKCHAIKQVFDDAYKSPLSVIIMDDVERLLDYAAIGPRYSNLALQTLLTLLKKRPPQGRKLMVIATTSQRKVLGQLQMLDAFSTVITASNLTSPEEINTALKEMGSFKSEHLSQIKRQIESLKAEERIDVGIKKLITLVEMAKQSEDSQIVKKFMALLKEEHPLRKDYMDYL